jgi:hypothetical protein
VTWEFAHGRPSTAVPVWGTSPGLARIGRLHSVPGDVPHLTHVQSETAAPALYISHRGPAESRANRTGDRPIVLVKAVLNALADP